MPLTLNKTSKLPHSRILRILIIVIILVIILLIGVITSAKISDYKRDRDISESFSKVISHVPKEWVEVKRHKQGGASTLSASRLHVIEYEGEWSLEAAAKALKNAGGQVGICEESTVDVSCRGKFDKYCVAFSKDDNQKIRLSAGSLYCGEIYDFE